MIFITNPVYCKFSQWQITLTSDITNHQRSQCNSKYAELDSIDLVTGQKKSRNQDSLRLRQHTQRETHSHTCIHKDTYTHYFLLLFLFLK